MNAMQNAFNAVGCILLLGSVGAGAYLLGLLRDEHLPLLSALVIKVALPAMIVCNLLEQYTPEMLLANVPALVASFASIALTMLLAMPVGKLLRLPGERLGVFVVMFSFSNSVFIGVPVSRALFGEAVLPYTLLYYIANTSMFWALGYLLMRKCGGTAGPGRRQGPPIPLAVLAVCVVLVFLRVSLPRFFMDACGYIGDLVTPLSLIFTGAVIARMARARAFRWEKGYAALLIGRFILCPALLLLCALPFDIPAMTRNALLVQAGMPVMASTSLVAASTGSDEEYAASGTALTTVLSLLLIPVYMFFIERVL